MTDAPKPCPFCGSSDLGSGGDDKIVAYFCNNCQATGPNHYDSRYDWNTRADLSDALVRAGYLAGLEASAAAIVEPISAYVYDVLYKMRMPATSHAHQKTYEPAQEAIRALADNPEAVSAIVAQVMEGK